MACLHIPRPAAFQEQGQAAAFITCAYTSHIKSILPLPRRGVYNGLSFEKTCRKTHENTQNRRVYRHGKLCDRRHQLG